MDLKRNPFYILGATTRDKKQRLIELCEEKSLLGDADECNEALAILTNAKRRIEAELFWFSGLPKNMIIKILMSIEQLNQAELFLLSPLVKMNIMINQWNFDINFDIEQNINIISEFDKIDEQELLEEINSDRDIANMPRIDNLDVVHQILFQIKNKFIRKTSERLRCMGIERYCQIIDELIKKYYFDNTQIIADMVEIYTINANKHFDKYTKEIRSLINNIKNGQKYNLCVDTSRIISLTKSYAGLVRPIISFSEVSGILNKETEIILTELLQFCLYLISTFFENKKAMELIKIIKEKFYVYSNIIEILTPLENILIEQSKKEYEKQLEMAREKEIKDAEERERIYAKSEREKEMERQKLKAQK